MKRRGTVYVLVLGIAVAVLTIAMGSISIVSTQARATVDQGHAAEAQAYALSGIELGRRLIAADPEWRSNRSNGVWINNQTIGSGSFTLEVNNPSGALNNSPLDPVILTATGQRGVARHKTQVTLVPTSQPVSCLRTVLFGAQALVVSSATLEGSGIVATNGPATAVSSLVYPALEAVSTISGGNYIGLTTATAPSRTVPDSTVFSYYIANGTAISINQIPLVSGARTINRALLSPNANPFSAGTNTQGIYVIDCANQRIIVQNSRIVGTLVLLNVGADSSMQGPMVIGPAVANYPALLVSGNFTIAASTTLNENANPKTNFNPPATPYNGQSNITTTDTYPTTLKGIYYVSGSLALSDNPALTGVMISGGTLYVTSSAVVTYDSTFAINPPPGFGLPHTLIPATAGWVRGMN